MYLFLFPVTQMWIYLSEFFEPPRFSSYSFSTGVLVFYCCITNCHLDNSLKQDIFLFQSFHRSGVWAWLSWVLCWGYHEAAAMVSTRAVTKMVIFKIKAKWSLNSVQQILMVLLEISANVIVVIDYWQLLSTCLE